MYKRKTNKRRNIEYLPSVEFADDWTAVVVVVDHRGQTVSDLLHRRGHIDVRRRQDSPRSVGCPPSEKEIIK